MIFIELNGNFLYPLTDLVRLPEVGVFHGIKWLVLCRADNTSGKMTRFSIAVVIIKIQFNYSFLFFIFKFTIETLRSDGFFWQGTHHTRRVLSQDHQAQFLLKFPRFPFNRSPPVAGTQPVYTFYNLP